MASPHDEAISLKDLSNFLQEQYVDKIWEQVSRFGKSTNRIFRDAKSQEIEVGGDGVTFHVEDGGVDTVRTGVNPDTDFHDPSGYIDRKVKARFLENGTATTNDFREMHGSMQVRHTDLKNKAKGAVTNLAKRLVTQLTQDYDEKLAIHRHQGSDAKVGRWSNGASTSVKQNDFHTLSGATAYPLGTDTGFRIELPTGVSPSVFQPGRKFVVYNVTDATYVHTAASATGSGALITVTDLNPDDQSVGFSCSNAMADNIVTTSLGGGDTLDLYFGSATGTTVNSEKDAGLYSFGAWFGRPASGDSFIGGLDRTSPDNRWMLTTMTRESAASAQLQTSMLNDLAVAMSFHNDGTSLMAAYSDHRLNQRLRDAIGEDTFIPYPTGGTRDERFAHFGTMGVYYQHPLFGLTILMADPLAPPNTIRFLKRGTWVQLNWGWKGFEMLPGTEGMWYRMGSSAGAAAAHSKVYRADGYCLHCDVCTLPKQNGGILNVRP